MFGKGHSIIQILEEFAPKYLAKDDDKIGLQVGTLNKEIKKLMLTLDVLENVVDEAVEKGVDLIISHHPIIYKPLKTLRTDLAQGKLMEKLIKNDISVYVAHTNLDAAENGVNDTLVGFFNLKDVELLEPSYTERLKKLVVFVPETHQKVVLDALAVNGAGWIGNYSHCSFNLAGKGTFMPRAGTNPYIGEEGKLEEVNEFRIETIVPESKQNQAIRAMLNAHPYEEVAYDIYPLDIQGKQYGIGRIGKLEDSMTLKEFSNSVKQKLHIDGIRVTGDLDKKVKKVAIVGGDGNSYVMKSSFKGADVLITGDIYYHVAHEAMAQNLAIIDVGHYIEKFALTSLSDYFEQQFINKKIDTEIIISEANTNPFKFL